MHENRAVDALPSAEVPNIRLSDQDFFAARPQEKA